MSSNVSFDIPWVPSFEGKILPPYRNYEVFVATKKRPDQKSDKQWTRATILSLTQSEPDAEDAIYESVLALWRLSRLADENLESIWQEYARAWLVSQSLAESWCAFSTQRSN